MIISFEHIPHFSSKRSYSKYKFSQLLDESVFCSDTIKEVKMSKKLEGVEES